MKKTTIIIFITLGIGAVLVIAYWLVSPLWKTVRVNESVPIPVQESVTSSDTQNTAQEPTVRTLATGTFSGFDRLHNGSGTASIIEIAGKYYVRFESDFKVTNGPDLYVGFGKNNVYTKGSELGLLKGTEGSQNYEIDATVAGKIQRGDYTDVWVWCKAFAVPFARASLQNL